MQTVLIVFHLMVVLALVAVVLLQRSEGGALGVGGGNGFMTGRGQANVLTRATAILAALFFATSLGLTILAHYGHSSRSILDNVAPTGAPGQTTPTVPPKGEGTVLDQLRKLEQQRAAPVSAGTTPATQPSPATSSGSRPPVSNSGTPSQTPPAQK